MLVSSSSISRKSGDSLYSSKSSSSFRNCRILLWLFATATCVVLWFATVLFFSTWKTDHFEQFIEKFVRWTDFYSFNIFLPSSGTENDEDLFSSSPPFWCLFEFDQIYIVVMVFSSCMPAVCWWFLKYTLKYMLPPQPESRAMKNVVRDTKDPKQDILLMQDVDTLESSEDTDFSLMNKIAAFVSLILTFLIITSNGMIAGRAVLLLHDDYGVSLFQAFACLSITAFTVYFVCDIIVILPCLWAFAEYLHFVFRCSPRTSSHYSSTSAAVTASAAEDSLAASISEGISICEICAESIVEGQVKVTSPTDSSTCTQHSCHLKCFVLWNGDSCPSCHAPLKFTAFDLVDNCFAWLYIICLMFSAWLINRFSLQSWFLSLKISALRGKDQHEDDNVKNVNEEEL